MNSVLGCVRSIFSGLCCGACFDDEVDLEEPKEKFNRYIVALERDCSICLDDFEKTDFVARRLFRTPCCKNYFHDDCLKDYVKEKKITCAICYNVFDYEKNKKPWNGYLVRIHKQVVTALGFRDDEVAREVAEKELEEQQLELLRVRKQIEADKKLADQLAQLE